MSRGMHKGPWRADVGGGGAGLRKERVREGGTSKSSIPTMQGEKNEQWQLS